MFWSTFANFLNLKWTAVCQLFRQPCKITNNLSIKEVAPFLVAIWDCYLAWSSSYSCNPGV